MATLRVRATRDYTDPFWGHVAKGFEAEVDHDNLTVREYTEKYGALEIVEGGPFPHDERDWKHLEGQHCSTCDPYPEETFAETVPMSVKSVDVDVTTDVSYDGSLLLAGERAKIPPQAVVAIGPETFRVADGPPPASVGSAREMRKRQLIRNEEGSRLRERVAEAEAAVRISTKDLADLDDRSERAGEKIDKKTIDAAKERLEDAKDTLRRRRTALERWDGETSEDRAAIDRDLVIAERRELRDSHQQKIDGLREKAHLALRAQLIATHELIAADVAAREVDNELTVACAAANDALGGAYYSPLVNTMQFGYDLAGILSGLRTNEVLLKRIGLQIEYDEKRRCWTVAAIDHSLPGRAGRVGRAVAAAIGVKA